MYAELFAVNRISLIKLSVICTNGYTLNTLTFCRFKTELITLLIKLFWNNLEGCKVRNYSILLQMIRHPSCMTQVLSHTVDIYSAHFVHISKCKMLLCKSSRLSDYSLPQMNKKKNETFNKSTHHWTQLLPHFRGLPLDLFPRSPVSKHQESMTISLQQKCSLCKFLHLVNKSKWAIIQHRKRQINHI